MNPFLRNPRAYKKTPVRAETPAPRVDKSGAAVLRLYDPIDSWGEFWGISAKEFVSALDELPDGTTEIQLLINSPGGEVWEALAILNALRRHSARVVAVVEGIAASSASFIAAGVDELRIAENAEFFVHNAWGLCVGNTADMTKMAADLGHEDRNIASIYAKKAGGDVDAWLGAMAAETWYSAEEAVAAGLADSVVGSAEDSAAAKAKNRFDLSPLAHSKRNPTNSSATEAEVHRKEGTMPTLNEGLAQRLGVAVDADDDTVLAALDEALDERAVDNPPAPPRGGSGQAAAAALPDGVVAVESTVLDELRRDASAGREARAQQLRDSDNAVVNAAVGDGRIAPARRDHWLNALRADREGATETLNGLEKGLVPLAETGHALNISTPDDGGDDPYTAIYGKDA